MRSGSLTPGETKCSLFLTKGETVRSGTVRTGSLTPGETECSSTLRQGETVRSGTVSSGSRTPGETECSGTLTKGKTVRGQVKGKRQCQGCLTMIDAAVCPLNSVFCSKEKKGYRQPDSRS